MVMAAVKVERTCRHGLRLAVVVLVEAMDEVMELVVVKMMVAEVVVIAVEVMVVAVDAAGAAKTAAAAGEAYTVVAATTGWLAQILYRCSQRYCW